MENVVEILKENLDYENNYYFYHAISKIFPSYVTAYTKFTHINFERDYTKLFLYIYYTLL